MSYRQSDMFIRTNNADILNETLIIGEKEFTFVHYNTYLEFHLIQVFETGLRFPSSINQNEEEKINIFMEEMRLKYEL
jgi:hypothetical protein